MDNIHNFHIPLPEDLYNRLKQEAERSKRPATILARQAIDEWLRQKHKAALYNAIADYAADNAGSEVDLNTNLESASIQYLAEEDEK